MSWIIRLTPSSFPERTPDGEYAVMGNHRGLAAITGYPVMSYNVNWEGTADGDKQYSQNGYCERIIPH